MYMENKKIKHFLDFLNSYSISIRYFSHATIIFF